MGQNLRLNPYVDCGCAEDCPSQWCFLGASVVSFSARIGWGNSPSTVTVELKVDPEAVCEGNPPKKRLNRKFQVEEFTDPDPGFFGDGPNSCKLIGVPVLFRFECFEFAGIVSSYTRSDSTSGIACYSVTVESPTNILSGLEVIIDEYTNFLPGIIGAAGPTNMIPNVANVYGLFEGVLCQSFGNSGNFGSGMPFNNIIRGLNVLAGTINAGMGLDNYLQCNRVLFVPGIPNQEGINEDCPYEGCGLIPEDDKGYLLDLSDVSLAPDFYMFSGKSVNFMDMISQYAEESAQDFYVDLLPCCVDLGNGPIVVKVLKLRFVDRSIQPQLGLLDDVIRANTGECGVKNITKGIEMRNEQMNTFLCGPCKEQLWTVEWCRTNDFVVRPGRYWDCDENGFANLPTRIWDLSDDYIAPYWGLDYKGDIIPTISFAPEDPDLGFFRDDFKIAETCFNANGINLTGTVSGADFVNCMAADPFSLSLAEIKGELLQMGYDPDLITPPTSVQALIDILLQHGTPDLVRICEKELLTCLAGFDEWYSHISNQFTATFRMMLWFIRCNSLFAANRIPGAVYHAAPGDINHLCNIKFNPINGQKAGHVLNLQNSALTKEQNEFIQKIHEWVNNYAQDFYGRKFIVRVPDICVIQDPDTLEYKFNFEVTDGGWNENGGLEYSPVAGLTSPSPAMDFFRLPDGRISPFVRFDDAFNLNFHGLEDDQYGFAYFFNNEGFVTQSSLWVKVAVDPDFQYFNSETLEEPRVIIELPQTVTLDLAVIRETRAGLHVMDRAGIGNISFFRNATVIPQVHDDYLRDYYSNVGTTTLTANTIRRPVQPNAAVIPLKNTRETYGPWTKQADVNNGAAGVGTTRVQSDPSLTPWNFGSVLDLNFAANQQACLGVSDMYCAESGSFTVPGTPRIRLGDEVGAFGVSTDNDECPIDSPVYATGQYYAATRVFTETIDANSGATIYSLDLLNSNTIWNGIFGPVITDISVQGGTNFCTTYSLNTFSRRLRRFQRTRLDRLKQLGSLRQEILSILQDGGFRFRG